MKRLLTIFALASLLAVSCSHKVENPVPFGFPPHIYPDYKGVTVPYDIAPLNFSMDECSWLDVTLEGDDGSLIHVSSPVAQFKPKQWRRILEANRGASIKVQVYGLLEGRWFEYAPFWINVSDDAIDGTLVYRLIAPGYEGFGALGIYQRDLTSYKERQIVGVDEVNGCINCHSFNQCDPSQMSLHVRGANGATIIRQGDKMEAFTTKTDSTISSCVYTDWHPSGKYIAYSNNVTKQGFFQRAENVLDVFDYESDIVVYDIESNELFSSDLIKGKDRWETFPAFSPDGRTLYFCAATPKQIPEELTSIRYNLCKIDFDPETATFGDHIDTLVFAESVNLSASFPKPSPDGRHLVYAASSYGNFTIWHNDSDLWLLDLETLETHPLLGVNSDFDADSYHSFSSDGRWMVFGSRRDDHTHTRAYICHFDEDGNPGLPFLLPQKDPRRYYDNMLRSYNLPSFATGSVDLDSHKTWKMLRKPERKKFSYRKDRR